MTAVRVVAAAAILLFSLSPAAAQVPTTPLPPAHEAAAATAQVTDQQDESRYDSVWKAFSELYRNESARIVQEVRFTGRFHHDLARVNASRAGDHDESNVRRLRFGPRIRFLQDYVFHAEIDINPQERDPFYVRFTDLYVEWSRGDALVITVGKQSVPFTQEGATSSKELLTIDRSNLANNIWFTQEYIPGIAASGEADGWKYHGGVYSAGAADRELGEFSAGYFTLATLGYDFGNALGVEEALVSGSYVHQAADDDNSFTQRLGDIGSLNLLIDAGRWGLRSDVAFARGHRGQSDLRALMVMPYVHVVGDLQFVGRYTLVDSAGQNGVRLGTYENRVVSDRGDRYDEIYAGANYYFYGHRLKLQTGVQWGEMDDSAGDGGDYSGVAWVTALRISW